MARQLGMAASLVLLAGCVPSVGQGPAVSPRPATFSSVGLENVMGADAAALIAQFGTPDLDIREGSARKLQFGSQICVLDAYLYPSSSGGEGVVSHIDARLPDGRDMDRASCVSALNARRQSR